MENKTFEGQLTPQQIQHFQTWGALLCGFLGATLGNVLWSIGRHLGYWP